MGVVYGDPPPPSDTHTGPLNTIFIVLLPKWLGGFEDFIVEPFGQRLNICDVSQGNNNRNISSLVIIHSKKFHVYLGKTYKI